MCSKLVGCVLHQQQHRHLGMPTHTPVLSGSVPQRGKLRLKHCSRGGCGVCVCGGGWVLGWKGNQDQSMQNKADQAITA